MIHISNETDLPADTGLINKILTETLSAHLSASKPEETDVYLQLLDDNQIQAMNEMHKGRRHPTDVLAFADGEVDPDVGQVHLGDIAISLETARREAVSRNIPPDEEAALYALHGLLHLLGWRDGSEEEKKEMRRAEKEELAKWQITPDW